MHCGYQWKTLDTCQGGLQGAGIQNLQGKRCFKKASKHRKKAA